MKEMFFAKDLKSNQKSELFNTPQEAGEFAKKWNRSGGFALVFSTTSIEQYMAW